MRHVVGSSQGQAERSGRGRFPGSTALGHRWCSLTSASRHNTAEKPGACPVAAPEGLFYPCSFPCLEDQDCLGMQKCCALGCGSACLEPVQGKAEGSSTALAHRSMSAGPRCAIAICHLPATMGHVPRATSPPLPAPGPWRGAREPQRRHPLGMLQPHTRSAPPDQPKPRECPTVQPGPVSPCQERCRSDSDCPSEQKCCSSSCGGQCLPAALAGEMGWDGQHGQGRGSGPRGDAAGTGPPQAQSCGTVGPLAPCLPGWALPVPAARCCPLRRLHGCHSRDPLHGAREGTGAGRGHETTPQAATIPLSPHHRHHPALWCRRHQPCHSHPAAAPPAEVPPGPGLSPIRGVLSPAVQPAVPLTQAR